MCCVHGALNGCLNSALVFVGVSCRLRPAEQPVGLRWRAGVPHTWVCLQWISFLVPACVCLLEILSYKQHGLRNEHDVPLHITVEIRPGYICKAPKEFLCRHQLSLHPNRKSVDTSTCKVRKRALVYTPVGMTHEQHEKEEQIAKEAACIALVCSTRL